MVKIKQYFANITISMDNKHTSRQKATSDSLVCSPCILFSGYLCAGSQR